MTGSGMRFSANPLRRRSFTRCSGSKGPRDPVSMDLTRSDAGHKDVPITVGSVGPRVEIDDPRRHRGVLVIEQQQLRSVLCLAKTLKLTLPGAIVAPSGKLLPFKQAM